MTSYYYKEHLIVLKQTASQHYYVIKKGQDVVCESMMFPTIQDADVHAKLYIDRIVPRNDGWIVS